MRKYPILVLLICTVMFAGCEKKPPAVVNGEVIAEKTLQQKIEERSREHQAAGNAVDNASLRSAVLNELISELLILQGAREANISVSDEEVGKRIDAIRQKVGEEAFSKSLKANSLTPEEFASRMKEQIMKEKFVATFVSKDSITEDAMRNFYQHSPKPFIKPESVQVRFIQTTTRQEADAIMARIKKAGFDRVADELSKDKAVFVSGYGWSSPDMFSSEIRSALDEMKKGAYGGPYQGRAGYYIFRVKDRENERPKTYEEAKEEIRNLLYEHDRSSAMLHWVDRKRKASDIVTN